MKFTEFPKMPRSSREIVITEKIDGTNASIFIQNLDLEDLSSNEEIIAVKEGFSMRAGSRTRWITPQDDNYGFANWVKQNSDELFKLGEGHHFGEWWGSGIQIGYGLPKGEKRFSLFNTSRWVKENPSEKQEIVPSIVNIVPELYRGSFNTTHIDFVLKSLELEGSKAAPGFMKPEGIIVYHLAGNVGFKKTIKKDEIPKSLVK